MTCQHTATLKPATKFTKIFKTECALCFNTKNYATCLTCFDSFCSNHQKQHHEKTRHAVVLETHIKSIQAPPQKITKLEIREPRNEVEYEYKSVCLVCEREVDCKEASEAVIKGQSEKTKSEIKAWSEEIKECKHTREVEQKAVQGLKVQNAANVI